MPGTNHPRMPPGRDKSMTDFYSVLGVPPDAPIEQIKERYRFLAHAYHPDKFSKDAHRQHADETFKAINEAFQTLSNPALRATYDRQRASNTENQRQPPPSQEAAKAATRRIGFKAYLLASIAGILIFGGFLFWFFRATPVSTWALPIKLGQTKENVFAEIGEPSMNAGEFEKKLSVLRQDPSFDVKKANLEQIKADTLNSGWGEKDLRLSWQQRGLELYFKDGALDSIEVIGKRSYPKGDIFHFDQYQGPILLGITSDDDLSTLTKKLGPPSKSEESFGMVCSEWRCPPYLIEAGTWAKDTQEFGVNWKRGQNVGSITIRSLAPTLAKEAEYERKKRLVALSGAVIKPQDIFRRYADRVLKVESINSKDKVSGLGTGFAWRGQEVITNRHVISQARQIHIKRYAQTESFIVDGSNTDQDWVILRNLLNFPSGELPPVVVADKLPEVGDEVTVIGNPNGLTNSLSSGVVAGIRKINDAVWIQITAPISKGSSGSPVFDNKGRLLGLATMMMVDGQNLNFATWAGQIVQGAKTNASLYEMLSFEALPLDPIEKDPDFNAFNNSEHTVPEMEKWMEQLLERFHDPEDQAEIFFEVESELRFKKDYLTLIAICKKKMELLGETYSDWESIGDALSDLERTAEAKDAYLQAIRLALADKGETANLEGLRLVSLAVMNWEVHNFDEANRWAKEVMEKHPKFQSHLYWLKPKANP